MIDYDLCKKVHALWGKLKSERSSWDFHYRDLGDFVSPFRTRFTTTDRNRGAKRHDKIIDGTASLALRTMAAGMMSGITSPARPWFKLGVPDPDLMELDPVREYLAEVERRMRAVFLRSNLYNALPNVYADLGLFGTSCMTTQADDKRVLRFSVLPTGSYAVANGADGLVSTMARELEMTAATVRQEFGDDAVSSRIIEACETGREQDAVTVIHAIWPNKDHDPKKMDPKHKRFRSVWVEVGGEAGKVLRDSGFDAFPALCPRWTTVGEDSYGIAPAFDALGDIRALQKYEQLTAKAVAKQIDPPMRGPASLRGSVVSLLPGGITWTDDRGGQDSLRPLHEVNFRIEGAELKSQQIRQRISRAFFEDLFLMLAQSDRRQITAREVEERHEEKLLMLGPVLERLNQELLDPLIDLTFAEMAKRDMLPPPPVELEGMNLRVEYISIMAQAQKMLGIAAVDRLMSFAGNLSAVNQAVLDKIDMDQAVDEYGDMLGVSPKIVRSDDEVAQMRAERAQVAARQQAAEQMALNAQSAKVLSETDTRGENALTSLMDSARGLPL